MAKNHLSSSLKESTYTEAQDSVLHLPLQGVRIRKSFTETGDMVGSTVAQKVQLLLPSEPPIQGISHFCLPLALSSKGTS